MTSTRQIPARFLSATAVLTGLALLTVGCGSSSLHFVSTGAEHREVGQPIEGVDSEFLASELLPRRDEAGDLVGRNLTREEWRQHVGTSQYRATCVTR